MSLGEAVGLIVWYVVYVLLVVLGRQYRQYMKRKRGLLLDDGSTAEKIAMVRTDVEADSGTTSPAEVEGTRLPPPVRERVRAAHSLPANDPGGTARSVRGHRQRAHRPYPRPTTSPWAPPRSRPRTTLAPPSLPRPAKSSKVRRGGGAA